MYFVDLYMYIVVSIYVYSILYDYIVEVKCKGIKFFVIIDYGLDMVDVLYYWYFVNMCIWFCLVDGVGILCGIELNIKNIEGEIDCFGLMLIFFDLIIVGFYELVFLLQDCDIYIQVMIVVMVSGKVYMISYLGNLKFLVDILVIVEVVVCYQVVLEINNFLFVLLCVGSEDNCWVIVVVVCDVGGWVVLGLDFYIVFIFGEFIECCKIFDVVDFLEERIFNVFLCCLFNFFELWGMLVILEFVDF